MDSKYKIYFEKKMFSFNDENWKLGFVYLMSYMWIKIKIEANLEEKASRHCRDKQNYFIWTNSNTLVQHYQTGIGSMSYYMLEIMHTLLCSSTI